MHTHSCKMYLPVLYYYFLAERKVCSYLVSRWLYVWWSQLLYYQLFYNISLLIQCSGHEVKKLWSTTFFMWVEIWDYRWQPDVSSFNCMECKLFLIDTKHRTLVFHRVHQSRFPPNVHHGAKQMLTPHSNRMRLMENWYAFRFANQVAILDLAFLSVMPCQFSFFYCDCFKFMDGKMQHVWRFPVTCRESDRKWVTVKV